MLNPEKVATPATAATVLVPDRVPVLGFVPIATVMFPVNPLAVLPPASWAVTSTAGVIAVAAVVVLGCTENTSCVAVPAVMLNAALIPVTGPGALAVSVEPSPALSMLRSLKVAIPALAPVPVSLDVVPESVPPPGSFPLAAVMVGRPLGNDVTLFPKASSTVTRTAGVKMVPAVVFTG